MLYKYIAALSHHFQELYNSCTYELDLKNIGAKEVTIIITYKPPPPPENKPRTHRLSPMPMASVATNTLHGLSGSLNFCAWAIFVPANTQLTVNFIGE